MNQSQRKYIIKRLKDLSDTAGQQFATDTEENFAKNQTALTFSKLVAGIKDGSIVKHRNWQTKSEIDTYDNIGNIFNLAAFDTDDFPSSMYDKIYKYQDKLKAELLRIEDELMLGDTDDALAMIAKFEKFIAK